MNLRTAHHQLAGFADRNFTIFQIEDAAFCECQRLPDRCRPIHFRRRRWPTCVTGRSLGHSISLVDRNAGKIAEPSREFGRKRSSARFDPAHTMIVRESACGCKLTKRIDGRWNHRHKSDVFLNHQSAKLLDIEARHQNERTADSQRERKSDRQTVDVVERQKAERHIRLGEHGGARANELIDIGYEIVVRQHDALRQSSCAAGVGKRGDNLRGVCGEPREFYACRRAQQTGEPLAAGALLSRSKDLAQLGKPGKIDAFDERSVGDEERGIRIFELIPNFAFTITLDSGA